MWVWGINDYDTCTVASYVEPLPPPLPSPPLSSLVPQSNNNLKPKEGEVTSRPWQWPLNMRVSTVHSMGWARGSKSTDHVHM